MNGDKKKDLFLSTRQSNDSFSVGQFNQDMHQSNFELDQIQEEENSKDEKNSIPSKEILQKKRNNMMDKKRKCDCKARILVVDDNDFNIIPIKLLIKELFNHEIDYCSNGAEAVYKYNDGFNSPCNCDLRAYRLIFMDINMPVMDGKEASKIILEKVE